MERPDSKRILISGAGIAGPTLAYWLERSGHEVCVIERAPALRLGGQNIDVSDAAVEIIKLMEIEKLILSHNTTEVGLQFVNEKNEVEAEFPKGTETSFTSKYEILRGDLTQILFDLTKVKVKYRFGQTISKIKDVDRQVEVTFESGEIEKYDLVVGADGVSSSTRRKIVDDPEPYKYLGVLTSYMTLPKRASDSKWARWFNAPKGKVILVRPDNKGTARASVNVWSEFPPNEHFTRAEAIATIRDILRGVGWEASRISSDLEADPDIYLGPVSQVRIKKWSKGRCVLVGDAAYCPTPFTGMGTTLAIIGAYVLAGELASNENPAQAFEEYERKLRPFVAEVQKYFPGQFRFVYPQSAAGVFLINKTAAFFASHSIQKLIGFFRSGEKRDAPKFKLPKYDFENQK